MKNRIENSKKELKINKIKFNRLDEEWKLVMLKDFYKDVYLDSFKKEYPGEDVPSREELDIDGFVLLSWENDEYKIEAQYDTYNEWDGNYGYSISLVTFKKENFEVYIKFNWTYSSWESEEWDNMEIVRPRKVNKIEYV